MATHAEVHLPWVNMALSNRFAYAYIDPECADPGVCIRRALKERAGNPPFHLVASSRGAMLVVFPDAHIQAEVLQSSPFCHGDRLLHLEPHENADNRLQCEYKVYAEVSATHFPLEN